MVGRLGKHYKEGGRDICLAYMLKVDTKNCDCKIRKYSPNCFGRGKKGRISTQANIYC